MPAIEKSLLGADGPRHDRVRAVVAKAFTARHIASLETYTKSVAQDHCGEISARGECEFVSEVARPLPAKVLAALLDIDAARWSDLIRWADAAVVEDPAVLDADTKERFQRDLKERDSFMAEHLKECRQGRRRGLFSTEVIAHLPDDEAADVLRLLLVAGHVTTAHLLGNLVVTLLRNPDVEDALRSGPKLIPAAVEETLRFNSPALSAWRRPARDVTLAGQQIPENSAMLLLLASANHSEERFADADCFRLDRDTQGHLAFGRGAHFCLGAPLARMEARVVLETVFERFQTIEAAEPLMPIEWDLRHSQMRGPNQVKLRVETFG